MSVPWNTNGISVTRCSYLRGWLYSVWHTNGMDHGAADTEAEAWEKARAVARFHRALPQGETP